MTQQQTEFRAVYTGARVSVSEDGDGPRWDCSGCGKGRAEADALEVAEHHARNCSVLSLS
ncbi:hypothetical protein [Streptomyces sp. NPDC005438]|uniref:hypothetical protein n=1 Tax=Streptomyces sp. NPDC005438 TaxID=3156880 RepID=UPI0033B72E77